MNVEVRPIKTAAETALATNFATVKRALPGAAAVAALREHAFRRFETEGLPHRRVEEWKYTDLRALMRDAKPLAGVPDAAAKARARQAIATLPSIDARRDRVRRRRLRAGTLRSCRSGNGPHHRLDGAAARGRRSASPGPSRQARADRRRGGRAQHRVHGRRRGDPCRGGCRAGAADPSRLRECGQGAGRGVRPLACRDRERRARHAGRKP